MLLTDTHTDRQPDTGKNIIVPPYQAGNKYWQGNGPMMFSLNSVVSILSNLVGAKKSNIYNIAVPFSIL